MKIDASPPPVGTAGITDGSVTRAKLANELWTPYTPTWVNLTVGAGVQAFAYCRVGGICFVQGSLTFAADTAMGTAPTMSLPVTSITYPTIHQNLGTALLRDTGTNSFYATIKWATTTTVNFRSLIVSGAALIDGAVDASTPFTWTTNDILSVNYVFQPAV